MNPNLPFSVLTANIISLLLGTLYLSNRQKTSYDKDMRIVLRMMGITAVSTDEQFIRKLIESAKENFAEEDRTNGKPYQLSASMGYAVSNLSVETIGDFMNRIDRQMYLDKLAYYEENAGRKR